MKSTAYSEMASVENHHWWFVARRAIIKSQLKKLNLGKNCNVLEVGVGTGGNLELLSNFGCVKGFDMSLEALTFARNKTQNRFEITQGHCPEKIPSFNQTFDLICMFDVLEHVEKDTETLKALKNILKKNGKLIVTVPAYNWLWSEHDNHLHHKRRYTRKRLEVDAKSAGWDVESSTYFNTILFPIIAIIRRSERIFKKGKFANADLPHKYINKILTFVFRSEKYLLKLIRLPFGVSIYACLTPNAE